MNLTGYVPSSQVTNIVLERAELLERVNESSQQVSEKEQSYIEKLRLSELRYDRLERESQAAILGLEMKVPRLFYYFCQVFCVNAPTSIISVMRAFHCCVDNGPE